eukprot:5902821-Alexandrium_andersonii.AAC.1
MPTRARAERAAETGPEGRARAPRVRTRAWRAGQAPRKACTSKAPSQMPARRRETSGAVAPTMGSNRASGRSTKST